MTGFSPRRNNLLKEAPTGRKVIILISDTLAPMRWTRHARHRHETIAADAAVYNLKIPGYNPPVRFCIRTCSRLVKFTVLPRRREEKFST